MELFIIIIAVVIVCAFTSALLSKIPSVRKQYREMDDHKLVEANVRAGFVRRSLLVGGFLVSLPLIFFAALFVSGNEEKRLFTLLAIGLGLISLCVSWFFREIFQITKVEIDFRQFQYKKDRTTEQSAPGDAQKPRA